MINVNIYGLSYYIDRGMYSRRRLCSVCGRRRKCYSYEVKLYVGIESAIKSVPFRDLQFACMSCAEERAFLVTGKRKVRM
jgi:hypothetical protein